MVAETESRVLVLGGGGHARVCAELLAEGGAEVVGVVAREAAPWAVDLHVGSDHDVERIAGDLDAEWICVALGNNAARREWSARVQDRGLRVATVRSMHSVVAVSAGLASGVQIFPSVVVNPGATVSEGTILNTSCVIEHECRIGAYTHIAPGAVLAGDVRVGDDALIGMGARILPGLEVGSGAVVGAGAVATRSVAAGVTVVGVPATEVRK